MFNTNKIIQGNALEKLKELPEKSINMCMTKFINPNTIVYGMSKYEYIAGIIDGEGYVGIRKSTWGMRNGKCKNPTYSERIQIKMQSKKIIELFKNTFGGHIHQDKKIYQSKNGFKTNLPMWVYSATDKIASEIAKKVLPYVIEKKEQIKCILRLRKNKETKLAKIRGSSKGTQMDKSILEYRDKLCQVVKDLNHHKEVVIPKIPQGVRK